MELRPLLAVASVAALALAPRLAHAEGFAGEGPTRMNSPALMTGGAVLTSLGALSLGGAAYVFIADSAGGGDLRGLASVVIGLPLLVNGLGMLAGGIPMIVIGSKRVPDEEPRAALSIVPLSSGAALRVTF